MRPAELKIVEGIEREHLGDALRVAYDAFAAKFRIGYRNADDHVRLFMDTVDTTSCISATADAQFLGMLTFQTSDQEFYRLKSASLLTKFNPVRAIRISFNLLLLAETVAPDEFLVDSLSVTSASRGLGVGTALMQKAEEKARSMGKRTMSLGMIAENKGAIRLYERLGYQTSSTHSGRLVRLVTGSQKILHMEKSIVD